MKEERVDLPNIKLPIEIQFTNKTAGTVFYEGKEIKSGERIVITKPSVEQVSIWKDNDELKELSRQNEQFLVRTKDGRVIMPILSNNIFTDDNQINKNVKEATTLTDFINAFEQMQKDIEKILKRY
jgi:hypothetical protein